MEEFRIVLADACKIVKESSRKRVISGADEDGRVMVEFSEPVGGRRVKMLTPDEINGMLYKEETPESPANAEEAMAEETEPPTAGQEESGESALERIPKDEEGNPQYTQTDAPTAWDAIVKQTEGDEDMARSVVDSMVRDKEAALKKLESSNPKPGATVAEKIAAAKEHKAAIEAARQELEQWKAIAEVENSRKAEVEAKVKAAEEEAKARAKAEEERRKKFSANMGSRYSLSDEYADNGEAFVKNEKGSTNLIEIPHEIFDRLGISPLPFKLTESMALHVYSHHAKELKLKTLDDAIDFVLSTIGNADHVRLGRDNSYVFSVENGKDRVGKRAITIVIGDNAGEFIGIRTSGYESIKKLKERPLLWERSAKAASEDVATPTITTIESLNDDETSSRTKSQSNGSSASKVSESSETKQEKAEKSISAKVKEASADVNTEPTEAQKEAGNYKKGHVQVGTFDITIEQPEGSIRRGTDASGKQWESKMHNTYGYFRGTEGVDGDHIDVFLSNDMDGWNGAQVFVVDQYNPDGTFDEHKVMLGFNDASDAKNNYLANYKKGWENGRRIDVSAVSLADFEKWIASSHRKTKPFSEYKSVKPADDSETFKGHKVENSGKDIEAQIKHLEEIKDYPGADKKIVQSEIDWLKAKEEATAKSKSKEENGVDDAKIVAVLEALSKGDEKAEQLVQGLTSRELSKLRSKVKASSVLENEWLHRVGTRGGVSLHDWLLENQYVEPVKRVSGTFKMTDYITPKDSPSAERLGGVYYDNSGFAVATDGRILVASKDDFDPKLKGKVIGKDGAAMENNFPNWQKAIPPAKETKSSNIDVEDLRKFVAGVLRANKRAYISLRFPDGTVGVFKANKLNLTLRAMKQLGTSELLYTKDGMKLVAKSEKGTALLMGLAFVEDELVEANGYAYPGNTVSYHRGEVVSELSPGERVLRDAVIDRLRESGLEVITDEEAGQRVLDEANGKAKLSAKKRRALETASLGKTPRSLTVVSSADGAQEIATIAENSTNKATGISDAFANVQTNLENLARVYAEKVTNKTRGFITDLSKALKLTQHEASNYGSFALPNGETLAIRISNHNARVSNFDKNDENNGISIVISSHKNKGLNNDGKAHIIEYFYHRRAIENATGKPLADIVKSIEQALYSGEFKDTTGLAQRQEVNAETIREHRVYHGSGADFDAFDHSHMGEGEGAQAYGWGTYVTEVEGIGRTYAEGARKKPTYLFGGKEMTTDEFHDYVLGEIGDRNENMLNGFMYNLERHGVTRAKDILKKGDLARYKNMFYQSIGDTRNYAEGKIKAARTLLSLKGIRIRKPKSHLYTVEIPNDNGGNYFDWVAQTGSGLVTRIREALRADEGLNGLYEGRKSELNAELEKFAPGMPFYETYAQLGDLLGSDKAASELLSSLGFAGIKYPADNMRGGREDGAKNYVIFNEKDARITDQVRFFRTESGEAYGFTVGGKIYIDPKIANTETPIHEYAHLWAAALRGQNPKEWQNIVELMKGTSVWDEVKKRYPELNTDDDIADEVLATYSGRRGAERLREEQRKIAGGKGGVFEKAEAISAGEG